jgi:nucleoside phosphorylase
MNRVGIIRLVDTMYFLLQSEKNEEVKQEVIDVGDALESGVITIHDALFWENTEARAIIRKAFSEAKFLHFRYKN